ncbi:DNA-binding transcriptional regulator [Variovorax sp. YR216]|uniref:helix-turn-helix domain-containing protein n=1 Tax=Variovorax sp. YR216 TaxID=1882828 RepID=UPI000895C8A7|nr:helix-turn-helix domain-containing protein [Variovorax sp. YR216]SEB25124.1 DNA-binding transcriptional regulator YiaG, contains XRE-type HTH domain [Variovorax sp. YR216]
MTNIASVLKSEISRIARKEIRAEIDGLKKANAQCRTAIAQLRRQVSELDKKLKQAGRVAQASSRAAERQASDTSRRFSAARLAAHRAKLGLSAAAYGKLVGMSGATIYLWEQGKSRPNAEQLLRLVEARSLSRSTALQKIAG